MPTVTPAARLQSFPLEPAASAVRSVPPPLQLVPRASQAEAEMEARRHCARLLELGPMLRPATRREVTIQLGVWVDRWGR